MATIEEALAIGADQHRAGRLEEAEAIYGRVLEVAPDNSDALHLLGLVRRRQGRLDEAQALILRALERVGSVVPVMLGNLGNVLTDMGRHGEAADHYRKALALNPDDPDLLGRLAQSLWSADRYPEAEAVYRSLIARQPADAKHYYNLGVTYQRLGRQRDAELAFRDCLRVDPRHAAAWNSLGTVLRRQGGMDEAVDAHRQAIALEPENWEAHKCLGLSLLQVGRFDEGWRYYEERRKTDEGRTQDLPRPEWDGSSLNGKTILVTAEQGLGDSLNFIRYVPLLKRLYGCRTVFGCQGALKRLLSGMPGIDQIVPFGEVLPPFDVWVPLMSVPRLVGTTMATIPASDPPITADPTLVARWATRLGPRNGELRVGVVWSGNPDFKNNRFRSPGLANYSRLFAVPGVRFYPLQKGGGRDELAGRTLPENVVDLGPEIEDFADTAAIVENLDLVITMCTSVAHLCGSMVRPVWVVLSYAPDWRWLMERADSPWYPGARLFRQKIDEGWDPVMSTVEAALRTLASKGMT
ncbi:MAG TPA: tetratricopeptide repeat-containing glycosyltransferase family protein [Azospirillaceae bacterium]|nr:tetratricopeptide repeat-containing glycosyltransferase family protein [Azospirillaceae bacterium]